MKKFVSMSDINSVFSSVDQVDYITVKTVSDSSVDLNVYLTTRNLPKTGGELSLQLDACGTVLGKLIDRTVSLNLIPAGSFGKISGLLSNLLPFTR